MILSREISLLRKLALISFTITLIITAVTVIAQYTNVLTIPEHTLHILHIIHTALIWITFFLLGAFLTACASTVAETASRELSARFGKPENVVKDEAVTLPSGAVIPFRCVLTSETSLINEYPLSGRKTPSEKHAGDTLQRGVINLGGAINITPVLTRGETMYDKPPAGSALYKVLAGKLAMSGIWIKSAADLRRLGGKKISIVYPASGIENRAGYGKFSEYIDKLGVSVSSDRNTPQIALCGYDEFERVMNEYPDVSAIVTHDKITHILKIVHYSRIMPKYQVLPAMLVFVAVILIAAAMRVIEEFTGFGVSVWTIVPVVMPLLPVSDLIAIRMIEKREGKLTFDKIAK